MKLRINLVLKHCKGAKTLKSFKNVIATNVRRGKFIKYFIVMKWLLSSDNVTNENYLKQKRTVTIQLNSKLAIHRWISQLIASVKPNSRFLFQSTAITRGRLVV